jgi:hypothetical protein
MMPVSSSCFRAFVLEIMRIFQCPSLHIQKQAAHLGVSAAFASVHERSFFSSY